MISLFWVVIGQLLIQATEQLYELVRKKVFTLLSSRLRIRRSYLETVLSEREDMEERRYFLEQMGLWQPKHLSDNSNIKYVRY